MKYLLLFYYLFLAAFFILNAIVITRVLKIRYRNDFTPKATLIYIIAVGVVVFASVSLVSSLNWENPKMPKFDNFLDIFSQGGKTNVGQ